MAKIGDVKVEQKDLLAKGYNAKDLLGKTFTVHTAVETNGDNGDAYLSCKISGEGLEEGRNLNTGAKNIAARLRAARDQNLLPVDVTVISLGGNALDIE